MKNKKQLLKNKEKQITVRIEEKYYNSLQRMAGPYGKLSSILREAVVSFVESKTSKAA